jgi:hypothetical protein
MAQPHKPAARAATARRERGVIGAPLLIRGEPSILTMQDASDVVMRHALM